MGVPIPHDLPAIFPVGCIGRAAAHLAHLRLDDIVLDHAHPLARIARLIKITLPNQHAAGRESLAESAPLKPPLVATRLVVSVPRPLGGLNRVCGKHMVPGSVAVVQVVDRANTVCFLFCADGHVVLRRAPETALGRVLVDIDTTHITVAELVQGAILAADARRRLEASLANATPGHGPLVRIGIPGWVTTKIVVERRGPESEAGVLDIGHAATGLLPLMAVALDIGKIPHIALKLALACIDVDRRRLPRKGMPVNLCPAAANPFRGLCSFHTTITGLELLGILARNSLPTSQPSRPRCTTRPR